MRRIIGCNVPDVDWGPPGGMTESEQIVWRTEVDKAVTGAWTAIIEEALTLRNAWEQVATPVVTWRAQMEAGRGILRVLLRAWREVVDDVRAGATKWESRWQTTKALTIPERQLYTCACRYWTTDRAAFWRHERQCTVLRDSEQGKQSKKVYMSPHTLARRLTFTPGHTSMWGREAGWRMRMILSWLRLVRAGKIQRSRRESPMWREGERIRISTVAASYKREVRRDESWADDVSQIRGQRYAWGAHHH